MNDSILLSVKNLETSFKTDAGTVRAVNGISFNLEKGKILGIVGESGSGKSVTAYSVMQILEQNGHVTGGEVLFNGNDLLKYSKKQMRTIRGDRISIIFQDPMTSLNPVYTIGNQIGEAVRMHSDNIQRKSKKRTVLGWIISALLFVIAVVNFILAGIIPGGDPACWIVGAICAACLIAFGVIIKVTDPVKKQVTDRCVELLDLVGITEPKKRIKQYPHELSGGMRQRVMIAMALACEPDILIADEPTTALDVTIQAQILELMQDLQKKLGMAIILVTHDLGVIADMCDEIIVMYGGRVCERGTADEIFYNPKHEYTKGLMRSIPNVNKSKERLVPIAGTPINMLNMPKGCAFAPRCDHAMQICMEEIPEEIWVDNDHLAACWMNVKQVYDEAGASGENV